MPEILDLPTVRLTHQVAFPRRFRRDAGTSLVGVPQRVGPGIKIWEVEIGLAPDWEPSRIKAFEAFIARLDSSTIVRLPLFDAYGYGAARSPGQQAWSDGTWFSDGTGWLAPGVATMVVAQGVAAGSNALWTRLTDPVIPTLTVGDYFSHDGFLYQVTGRTADGWVRFAPNARRAIPVGAVLQTSPPQFCGYPEGDDFGRRGRDLLSHAPAITLSFTEAFDR